MKLYYVRKICETEIGDGKGFHYFYQEQTTLNPNITCPDHPSANTREFSIISQSVGFPTNYIFDLLIKPSDTNPNYKIDIGPGVCSSDDDSFDLILKDTLTIDLTQSGANGLDTGVEQADTCYYIWLIYNPTLDLYAGLFSTSHINPILPSGYTKKRRIGSVRNNSNSNITKFVVHRTGNTRLVLFKNDYQELSDGTATTYTEVDFSSSVPVTSQLAWTRLKGTKSGDVVNIDFREKGSIVNISYRVSGYHIIETHVFVQLDSNQIMEYKVNSGATLNIHNLGYYEDL